MREIAKYIGFIILGVFLIYSFDLSFFGSTEPKNEYDMHDQIIDSTEYQDLQAELEDTKTQLEEAAECNDSLIAQLDDINYKISMAQDEDSETVNDTLFDLSMNTDPECSI